MESIDIHWHVLPTLFVDALREHGLWQTAELVTDDHRGVDRLIVHAPPGSTIEQGSPILPALYDDQQILAALDQMKLDLAAVSVTPSAFFHWAEPKVGAKVAALVNDGIAELARAHPDRIVGLASLPLQDANLAVAELERAVTSLGFRGAEICTNVNGADLDDERLRPVFAEAERLRVPLFIHPQNVGTNPRLADFHLWNLVGFPTETALAAARLIFGGVFERFPNLRVVLAHGGGYLPYQLGRLDHGYAVRAEPKQHISRPPTEYLGNIYFDALTHNAQSLQFLVDRVGEDRVVIGTDYPFDMGISDPVDRIKALRFESSRERKILGQNLVKLLQLA